MNNQDFIVSTKGHTAQDLQDLIDLAVFVGFYQLDGIAGAMKSSEPYNEFDINDACAIGFCSGGVFVWSEIIDRNTVEEKSYDDAVNYFINLNK